MRIVAATKYLRHPYLIWRGILYPLEERDSRIKCTRTWQYAKYRKTLNTCLIALGLRENQVSAIRLELAERSIGHSISSALHAGGVSLPRTIEWGPLLFVLVRALRPGSVIETGVANGVSTAFILAALHANDKGQLYSIDLHYREGLFTPKGKELGWVVPAELRDRWTTIYGESVRVLPRLLAKLGSIDVFLHDSRHTYRTMLKEYEMVWPHLREGGVLVSDDVVMNDAFLDFCDKVSAHPSVYSDVGLIRKNQQNIEKTLSPS